MPPESIQILIGAALTVAVLSYLIGDNVFYRLAMHVLVGVGAAYALGVAIAQVLVPRMFAPLSNLAGLFGGQELSDGEKSALVFALFGLLGSVFLLSKLMRRAAWLGNVAVGYMLGVGAGVAVGGALFGTLVPQTIAAADSLRSTGNILSGLLLLVATLATLLSFAYSRASRRSAIGAVALLGRGFLYVAFGATFALVFITGASVLSGWVRDIVVLLTSGS